MRIIHISTSITGGAGKTAQKVALLQEKAGHTVRLFHGSQNQTLVHKVRSKSSTLLSLVNATSNYGQVTHLSTNNLDLREVWEFCPDVIYIHNWFNLLTLKDLRWLTTKFPTVFYAHDERMATGGCHVTLQCENYKSDCENCPAARIKIFSSAAKEHLDSIILEFGNYGLVTPSRWLMKRFQDTPIYNRAKIREVIPNPSQIPSFAPEREIKQSNEPFKILFVASDLNTPYKGLQIFVAALKDLRKGLGVHREIEVKLVGKTSGRDEYDREDGISILPLGRLPRDEVQILMKGSDLLIVPSLSENYPGVVAEAQLNGCLVAASRVGGIPEMIEDGVSGFLFDPEPASLKKCILRVLSEPRKSEIRWAAYNTASVRHEEANILEKLEFVQKSLAQFA